MTEHSFDAYIKSDTSLAPQPAQITSSNDALNPKNRFKILCFGDSLTEGYTQWGSVMAPYSTEMRRVLVEKLGIGKEADGKYGEGWGLEVETEGVSGEEVREMPGRMKRVCECFFFFVFCVVFGCIFGSVI